LCCFDEFYVKQAFILRFVIILIIESWITKLRLGIK